ncbi:alpha/beta fold hydrolase [Actinokineospora fastidiosa]|uniref:Alpha/beta hydrolase n=1 Tax=Actinokineospora fastidiosa TaxID=1816 RepID=A0A918LDL4_9PSEU|nr:alpha/beta hydrolase [Actinokineospora fastidiosa]GGS35131.1 alpha/beta hydrolase [Actinokineospora fastidiosa]
MAELSPMLVRGRTLQVVDFGGDGPPVLALHGHFGRARMWAAIAGELDGRHRVIALEQRAHGRSDRGPVSPDDYRDDVGAVLAELGPMPVVGHSMGGIVAFRAAARYPGLVTALVVIDSPVRNQPPEVPRPVLDVSGWPRRAPTLAALRAGIEAHGIPDAGYFLESAVEHRDGWGLLFDAEDMMASQRALVGDWWPDWLAATCPALLVHGADSFLLPTPMARDMAARRPGTTLRVFPGGHWVHDEHPGLVAAAIAEFLSSGTA